MYNKLFTKILDSSVWLESASTRLVWLTLIAAMDEHGFAAFAAVGNLANRARVPLKACELAIERLESPDSESGDPDHNGRRVERVPGGWMVLNSEKYRNMVTRVIAQDRTRERVRKHRARKAGNAGVTPSNVQVTQSEAYSEAYTEAEPTTEAEANRARALVTNPHAKPTNLINGADLRRHGQHAWCDTERGMCVPFSLQDEFKKKGLKTDVELARWYPTVIASMKGQPMGDNVFAFWQSAFAQWVGTVAVRPFVGKGQQTVNAAQRVLDRMDAKDKQR